MVMHKAHGCGGGSTGLLVHMKVGQEAGKAECRPSAHFLLLPFFFLFSLAAHAMNWFCSHSGRIFTPQLLLSGQTVTAITKPKLHLVDILGISKSNQTVSSN